MAGRTCERCGSPLPPDARFCPRCGAPVAEPAPLSTEERRVVSVLFADLAGSTELATRLDPERLREVMAEFYRTVSAEIESLRGRAEKFVGDAVMAVWGLPHAHDDDALRAVRAGVGIREAVARLGERLKLPVPLRVRVGINSGAVATGSGPADQFLVSGATVNLAARLQEGAEPGEVLVGETTRQLTQHAIEYGPPRSVAAKGFEDEITAYPVMALSPRSARRTIPLVDRRRELALLVDTFERVRDSGRAHLVTVLGEPGIGKSRLVDEFLAALPEDVRVLSGAATDFEEDVTFAPVAEMVLRLLGVDRETPAAVVRKRLEEVASGCCDPPEAELVAGRLGRVLGLDEGGATGPEAAREQRRARLRGYVEGEGSERHRWRKAEVRAGLEGLLEGLTRAGPVVLAFEDMQLATPDLLDVVEELIRRLRRLPLLVLCLARDELLDLRPGWGGGIPDAVTLRLEPLESAEARELAVAAGESIDGQTAERIVELAGGNPFFIIETTGMLLQQHPAHREGTLHGHILPPTVQAVVAARIDHLPDQARELLRRASVFGRSTFSTSDLALVAEPDQGVLEALEEEEFLVRDPERPGVWRFRHEVLRDVAYESLSKRDRMRLHLQVADGLTASPEADRYPQVVAFHLEQAARASLDLDPTDRTVPDRAVQALVHAANLARWRLESRSAAHLYRRALELAGPEEQWGRREGRILAGLGEARYWLGEFDRARGALTRALEVAGDDPATRTHALRFLGDIVLNVEGDEPRASQLFDQALAAARELGDPYAVARTLLMAGWAPYWRGDLEESRRMFEEALEVARGNPEGDRWAEARALTSLAPVVSATEEEPKALALAQRALEVGREMGDPFTVAVALEHVGNSFRRMLRLDEALPCLEESVRIFRDLGARWELASALGDRGTVHRLAGRLREAERDLREALELCRALGEKSLVTWTATELATVLRALGERDEGWRLLRDPAIQPAPLDTGARIGYLEALGLAELAEGHREKARARFEEALALDRERGSGRWPNERAARIWLVGRLFGPDMVGGEEELEAARRRLEKVEWREKLAGPDLVAAPAG